MTRSWPIVLAALALTRLASAAPAVFSDATFADADWSVTPFTTGNGGSVEATQDAAIGTPPPSRRIRNAVSAAPSPTEFSLVNGVHLSVGAVYDPQVSGPIASVDYREDALLIQGFGDGQATGMALRQGGAVYIRQLGTTPDFAWVRKEEHGVPASGFVRLLDGGADPGQHPDFSASGGPIEFGFFRSDATSPGANGYEIVAAIDNWTVLVNTPCVSPADCVYPDACFIGTCDAGACRASAVACDDGDPCTADTCSAGVCDATPLVCNDGDPCTTDACASGGCAFTPVTCDDAVACTVDVCTAGTCTNTTGFEDVDATIAAVLGILEAPPCGGDGVAAAARRKLKAKLSKARRRLDAADAATRARRILRLIGKADRLLSVAETALGRAQSAGVVTPACAASLGAFLDDLRTCVAELARA